MVTEKIASVGNVRGRAGISLHHQVNFAVSQGSHSDTWLCCCGRTFVAEQEAVYRSVFLHQRKYLLLVLLCICITNPHSTFSTIGYLGTTIKMQ